MPSVHRVLLTVALIGVANATHANEDFQVQRVAQATSEASSTNSLPPDSSPETEGQEAGESRHEQQVEEITVIGDRGGPSGLETADSVTSFDASDLEALGAQDIADIADFTPNLEIVKTSSTSPNIFIRGVGLSDFNANATGAVAVYEDDVPKNLPGLQLTTLFDIARINVLKGPQGSGPGRNASAGAIKVYSRVPTGNYGAYLRSSVGNYNSRDFEGAVELPVYKDLVASRFAFRFSQRDGYQTNRCAGAPPAPEISPGLTPFKQERVYPYWVSDPNDAVQSPITVQPNPRDTGYSGYCGERMESGVVYAPNGDFIGVRYHPHDAIPAGLAETLNDQHRWGARGEFRLNSDEADMDWRLNLHGTRLNEFSFVGQPLGTNSPQGNGELLPNGEEVQGALIGTDVAEYRDRDVIAFFSEVLASQEAAGPPSSDECAPTETANQCVQRLARRSANVEMGRLP